jgi:hypothetical protein
VGLGEGLGVGVGVGEGLGDGDKQEPMLSEVEPYAFEQCMPSLPETCTCSKRMFWHGACFGQRNSASFDLQVEDVTPLNVMSLTLMKSVAPEGVGLYSAFTVMQVDVSLMSMSSQVMFRTKPGWSL